MAVQEWTIITLVGPAADDAAARFQRWLLARRSTDPTCFTPKDWPAATRRSVAGYLERLNSRRWGMPVAYHSRHIDLWSGGGQIEAHLPGREARVWHDAGELWCVRLPDRGRLARRNKSLAASAEFAETRWLASRLLEAAEAFNGMWRAATVLVNRSAVSASPSDAELKAGAAAVPTV